MPRPSPAALASSPWEVRPRAARKASALACVLVLAGCYQYLPVEVPAPGSVARVQVPVVSALSDPTAPPPTVSVEGVVLESGDTLVLKVLERRRVGALREVVRENSYRVALSELTAIEVRERAPAKSAALGSVIVAGAVYLAVSALRGRSGSGGEGPGGNGGRAAQPPPGPGE
ncbi:MAG: hypothetical protein OXG58_06050 [Gemmatimonadetes bacterium]|nr:hypothetical protein [Gemmatimonadota bacterium]MCY3942658.1 hypothetical protein [Gemmatimonadota bacterium]